jgi:ATP-dependent DNA helicase RecG
MDEFIQKLLNAPTESQILEFKRLDGNKVIEKIIETIVAMANTDGGLIVLGIDDPEKTTLKGVQRIFGIEENLDLFDNIGREIQFIVPPLSNIWPPQKIHVEEVNKTVGILFVPKAVDGFKSKNKKVYIRQEKSNLLLSPQEIIKFSYAKGFERADKELVDVSLELLETETYRIWKNARKLEYPNIFETLLKTGLARKDKDIIKPTRAAVLLFADHPSDLMDTKSTIRVFQYEGNIETIQDVPNLIGVPETIEGPIIKQIAKAHEYVLSLLRSGIRIPSGFTTQYLIPERAIKEAVTNAVIHRDYYVKRDITVRIFEDRVEIESPGLLPFNITPSNIGYVRSEGYRNDLLVKHLREFPEPPNLDQNEGIRAMRAEMKAGSLYPPIFITYPYLQDGLRVVLLNEKIATEWEKVSYYLERNDFITNEQARKLTGVVQTYKMTKILKNWVEKGLLNQIVPKSGFIKGTQYRLPMPRNIQDSSIS